MKMLLHLFVTLLNKNCNTSCNTMDGVINNTITYIIITAYKFDERKFNGIDILLLGICHCQKFTHQICSHLKHKTRAVH